jgi:hypothetical protein
LIENEIAKLLQDQSQLENEYKTQSKLLEQKKSLSQQVAKQVVSPLDLVTQNSENTE